MDFKKYQSSFLTNNFPVKARHANYDFLCCPEVLKYEKLECGPMPNVIVALPNIGGALCSTPQNFADAQY